MHHLLAHHVLTHVVIPLVVTFAIGAAIASQDSRGTHPRAIFVQPVGKLPTHSKY